MAEDMSVENELDFTSPAFNALRALYTTNLKPPVPNVHIFNNVYEYAKSLREPKQTEESDLAHRLKNIAENKVNKLRSRKRDPSKLEHLMKVKSKTDGIVEKVAMLEKTKKKAQQMNVLERMEEKYKEGPLSILYNCIEKKTKLKVWTRKLKGLRGVCVGYLIAFDKHMNLAMMDVDELFAIEEEIELDPKESLRRIEKKKDKKRKWRRKKREKLRQNETVGPVIWNEEERKTKDGERDSLDDDQGLVMKIKAKKFSTANIALFESNMNTEDSKNCAENDDCIDVHVGHQLEGKNIQSHVRDTQNVSEKTRDNQSYNLMMNVKVKECSTTYMGVVESNRNLDTEDSENNLIQANYGIEENLHQSNSRFLHTEFKTSNDISREQKLGEAEMAVNQRSLNEDKRNDQCKQKDRSSIENDNADTAGCEDNESIEHLYNEFTIGDILEEVKQTESELEEARTLLSGGRSGNTYLRRPSASLEGNVLEYDEESQDSVSFKDTDDNESSSMCVQTLTLHHKIIYGMEEIRGKKQDCEMVGSLVNKGGEMVDGAEEYYEMDGRGITGNDGGSDGALADERSNASTRVGDSKHFDGGNDDDGNDYRGSESDGMIVHGRSGATISAGDGKEFDSGSGDDGDVGSESDSIVVHGRSGAAIPVGDGKEFDSGSRDDGDVGSESDSIVVHGRSGASIHVGDGKEFDCYSGDNDGGDTGNDSDGSNIASHSMGIASIQSGNDTEFDDISGSNSLYDGGEDTGDDYEGSDFIVAYGDGTSVSVGEAKESDYGRDADGVDASDGNDSDHNNRVRIVAHGGDTAVGAHENDGNFTAGNGSNGVEDLGKNCVDKRDGDCLDHTDHDADSTMETNPSEQKHEAPNDQYLFNVDQIITEEVTERDLPETDDDIQPNIVHSYDDIYVSNHKDQVTGIDQHQEQFMSNTDDQTPTQDISMDRRTDDVFEVDVIESNVECHVLAIKSDETAEYEASKSEMRPFGEDAMHSAEDGSSEAKFDTKNFENNGAGFSVLLQEGKEIKEEGTNSGKEQQSVELNEIQETSVRSGHVYKSGDMMETTEQGRTVPENEKEGSSTREGKQSVAGYEAKGNLEKPSYVCKSGDMMEITQQGRNIKEKEARKGSINSVAGNEVKENLEKLSDVYKSGDMTEITQAKENIDEKEEGELTSSSDEQNLDLCATGKVNNNKELADTKHVKSVDIKQRCSNLDKNESKHTNLQQKKKHNLLQGSESHLKKSIVGKDETSSIKAQRAGEKNLCKRRHSIASTREKSCKTTDKSEHKLEKERRQSLGERVLDRCSRIVRTKDGKESKKISDSKERKSHKDNTKTSEKRQRSGTDQKLDTSSRRNDTRGKECTTRSKSITSRYGTDSTVEKTKNSSEKTEGTVSDSKLEKTKKEIKTSTKRCGKQQIETEKVQGCGDKKSRLDQTRPKESSKVANTSKDSMKPKHEIVSSESFTKLVSNSNKTESGDKRSKVNKTGSKESGSKVKSLSNTKSSSTPKPRQDGSSSESFTKLSKSKKELESDEKQHQLDRTQVGKSEHKTFPNTISKIEDTSKSSVKSKRKNSSGSEASIKHSSKCERETKSGREQGEVINTSKSSQKSERKTSSGSEASIKHSSKYEQETKSGREQREMINTSKSSLKSERETSSRSEASIKHSSKCEETKSGREQREVTSASSHSVKSKRESSSSSEFIRNPSSNKEELMNESKEGRGKLRGNNNTRRSSNPSVKTRIVRVSDKNGQEERKCDTKKSVAKTKEKTDSKKTAAEEREVLGKRDSSGLKSRDNSSESSSLKKDTFRTGKRKERKVSSEKDSLETNVRVKEKISSSNNEESNYKQGSKLKLLKKEQSLSKSKGNRDERNVESSKRTSAKGRSLSSDEKSQETKKQRVSKSDKTQGGTEITGNVEEESAYTKIIADQSLKRKKGTSSNPNEESQKTSINSDKQKDAGVKTTTRKIVQKDTTETPEGKAVAKRKLTMDECKRTTRLRSKNTLGSGKVTCNKANSKTDKPKQPKTLKQSENVQQIAKSNPRGQSKESCDENRGKLPGKRKRDDTPVRPRKVQKTTKIEPNKRTIKTKEAKLPGNVITVRILKVDRGKALVLKRRHVNQLFIRGDNIIMVAYESVESSKIKL